MMKLDSWAHRAASCHAFLAARRRPTSLTLTGAALVDGRSLRAVAGHDAGWAWRTLDAAGLAVAD